MASFDVQWLCHTSQFKETLLLMTVNTETHASQCIDDITDLCILFSK